MFLRVSSHYVQVSSDLSIIDLDVPFNLIFSISGAINAYATLVVLAIVTWQDLIITVPMLYLSISLQVILDNTLS